MLHQVRRRCFTYRNASSLIHTLSARPHLAETSFHDDTEVTPGCQAHHCCSSWAQHHRKQCNNSHYDQKLLIKTIPKPGTVSSPLSSCFTLAETENSVFCSPTQTGSNRWAPVDFHCTADAAVFLYQRTTGAIWVLTVPCDVSRSFLKTKLIKTNWV